MLAARIPSRGEIERNAAGEYRDGHHRRSSDYGERCDDRIMSPSTSAATIVKVVIFRTTVGIDDTER